MNFTFEPDLQGIKDKYYLLDALSAKQFGRREQSYVASAVHFLEREPGNTLEKRELLEKYRKLQTRFGG